MDTASIDIAASPEAIYDLVADVTNMGRWSPECTRCAWLDGATEAAPGVRFKGWNETKAGPFPVKWSTTSTIKVADRGRELSFGTKDSGATWTYRFEAGPDGTTTVTETRTDGAKPFIAKAFAAIVGNAKRDRTLQEGMRQTLQRLKDAAEAG